MRTDFWDAKEERKGAEEAEAQRAQRKNFRVMMFFVLFSHREIDHG